MALSKIDARREAVMFQGETTRESKTTSPADPAAAQWHRYSIADTSARLGTSRSGLTKDEAARRLAQHGPNLLAEAPPRSKLAMFMAQFADVMVLILVAAAVLSGIIGDLTDTIVIVAIVVLNATLGFVQEYRADRAMAALKAHAAPSATVIRDGTQSIVPAADLVPGDLVVIDAGRIVPADLRLVEVADLRLNEAALTGESVPVEKVTHAIAGENLNVGDRHNMAHRGSVVTHGRGIGIVVATGMHTEFGRIAQLLAEAVGQQTPLQRRLNSFGRRLVAIVLLICVVVFVTGLLRGEAALPMLLAAVSLGVAAIPEALPAVVSISLALGARKMLARRALIRRLPVVETLGSVTYICSDKTGTLTANRMQVEQYFCNGRRATTLADSAPERALLTAMILSHDAVIDERGHYLGDPTECALLQAALANGVDREQEAARAPRVAELPFTSERKCMTTVHRLADGTFLAMTKGATEVVIAASARELRAEGAVPIDRARLTQEANAMAAEGLRVLGFAIRRLQQLPDSLGCERVECDLDFIGLVGLIDPPHPEVPEAIATCRSAGIVPVMITGDHPLTARAIAARIGLETHDGAVLTGAELHTLTDAELEERARHARVYARVSPEQKMRIVKALQSNGEVVAMTGDGVNDAPALKLADVGVAMGIQGTDVSKEASGIVLLDDNFATIVAAVREGRRIYDNLRRFVRYVLTTNSAEIWAIFLAPFVGLPLPLLPIHILWINLLTDGLPGLALASEPPEPDVMQRPPRPPGESLFARGLGTHALFVGLLMAALALAAEAWFWTHGAATWQTVVLTMMCFTQLAHAVAIRSERTSLVTLGIRSNRPLLGAIVITLLLQLAIVYVPALNPIFKTTPLGLDEMMLCVAAALVILVVVEAEKWVRRRAELRSTMVAAHAH